MKIKLRNGSERPVDVDTAASIIKKAKYVRWYDALPPGKEDQLELLDLAFPAFLGAVPNFKALLDDNGWVNLTAALSGASDILQRVPSLMTLADWPKTPDNHELLVQLFQATTGAGNKKLPGFGPARCTKMLHKKRPALIPIIDSWQLEAWGKPTQAWRTDDMAQIVFSIQEMIIPYAHEYSELSERLKLVEPPLPNLSAVRLYDILFWEQSNLSERSADDS